tara:strand:+ start:86 stop:328 length:243 start_codon:yes stop_codon:yes gene_type:complete
MDMNTYNEWLKKLGQSIQLHRKSNKFTQQDLAKKSGIHLTSVQMIEQGRKPLTTRTLHRICDAIGVEVRDVVNQTSVTKK